MRTIEARQRPFVAYSSMGGALRGAAAANVRLRTVSDEQVRGRAILGISWSDSALVFQLDDGRYLNLVALADRVMCSLDENPSPASQPPSDGNVMLALDESPFEWPRADLAHKYVGQTMKQLYFGDDAVFVYPGKGILMCSAMETRPDAKPLLYWAETD
jgi:hypothetical protein